MANGFLTNLPAWGGATTGMSSPWGGFGDDIAATFTGQPSALWQAARTAQLGERAALPQWQRTIMQGFNPTFGGYLLGGAPGTFSDYLQGIGTAATGYGGFRTPSATPAQQAQNYANWQSFVDASAGLANPGAQTGTIDLARRGLLEGENARRNALAIANAAMGGGIGMGAQARERALGNLYDLYAARAAGAGTPAGGFLSWLSPRLNIPTGATGPAGMG